MLLHAAIQEAGYSADHPVISNMEISVNPGELVGVIGPNGAGKSSLIKTILDIMNEVKGDIHLAEYAYIPERPIFYERLTLWEHIDFLLSVSTEDERQFTKKAEELLDLFQLSAVKHHFPENFSKGMQQKLMIILAFLKLPELYIIDEPFMGLDPKAVKKLLSLIEKKKSEGAGIFMSTHALDTAEKICDRFILILDGRIVFQGTLEEIRENSGINDGSLLDCFDALTEGESHDG